MQAVKIVDMNSTAQQMSEKDKRVAGDKEAAMRYAKLADSASSKKMRAYWTKCAWESAISAARNNNQQPA